MAQSFDRQMLWEVSRAISDEVRGKCNDFMKNGGQCNNQYGLVAWAPVVNVCRDPRWGSVLCVFFCLLCTVHECKVHRFFVFFCFVFVAGRVCFLHFVSLSEGSRAKLYGPHIGPLFFREGTAIVRSPPPYVQYTFPKTNKKPKGRCQETYGEDPLINGELATAYIQGIQFDPKVPNYYETLATCKHFDVHAGPENIPSSRFSFDSIVSYRDWIETFQPAFKACTKAGAVSHMCSYNEINGVPSCANGELLSIPYDEWNFTGFIVSDVSYSSLSLSLSAFCSAQHVVSD